MFIPSKKSLILFLSVLLIYGCNGNTSQKNTTTSQTLETASNSSATKPEIKSPTPPANPFESVNYPQPDCGEPLPQNEESYPVTYYPVYAENIADNLRLISSQFCQDAFATTLPNAEKVIQVASFRDREKADLFKQFLDKRISGNGLVGKPSIIKNPLESK
ncbi:MAG: hypothetical protein QNJ41_13115 [Xenococcaceae cyanobacterium MO_188.B32]|nr:hypothetical protein [Xenococcaceae cyanobacterium MO_188.B32]